MFCFVFWSQIIFDGVNSIPFDPLSKSQQQKFTLSPPKKKSQFSGYNGPDRINPTWGFGRLKFTHLRWCDYAMTYGIKWSLLRDIVNWCPELWRNPDRSSFHTKKVRQQLDRWKVLKPSFFFLLLNSKISERKKKKINKMRVDQA